MGTPNPTRNFIVASYKALLGAETALSAKRWNCIRAALEATRAMHPILFAEISSAELPRLTSGLSDERLPSALRFVISMPEVFNWAHQSARVKTVAYLRSVAINLVGTGLIRALANEHLRTAALDRIGKLTTAELGGLIAAAPEDVLKCEPVKVRALAIFLEATSFSQANDVVVRVMRPLARGFSESQIQAILDAARDHSEYPDAVQTPGLLMNLRDVCGIGRDAFLEEFRARDLGAKFPFVDSLDADTQATETDIPF